MSKRTFNPINPNDVGFDMWFRSEPCRNLKYWYQSMQAKNLNYLTKSSHDKMTIEDLIDSYLESNKRSYKNYKPVPLNERQYRERFGEQFLLYLGRSMSNDSLIKIVKEFVSQITYGENRLPYIAFYSLYGECYYVHIWIADREYLKCEPKLYQRDFYQRPNGSMCGRYDPEATLIRKKGDPMLDGEGNPILTTGWRRNKTRIFTENYKSMLPRLRDALVAVFYKVFRQVNVMLNYQEDNVKGFEQILINRDASEWKKRTYREAAALQYYIRYVVHRLMTDDIDNYRGYDMLNVGLLDYSDPPTKYGKHLKKLFDKYRKIFVAGYFKQNNKYFPLFKTAPGLALINLVNLRNTFKSELLTTVREYCPKFKEGAQT